MHIARQFWEFMGKNGNLFEKWRFKKSSYLHIDGNVDFYQYIDSISFHKIPIMRVISQEYMLNRPKLEYSCQISVRKIEKREHLP